MDNQDVKFELPHTETKSQVARNNIYLTHSIAYYNLGASLEHMANLQESIRAYSKALSIAEEHLGPDHALTNTIKSNMEKAE